jgi:tetrahydromethanopterin S-methyltransferase subunit F
VRHPYDSATGTIALGVVLTVVLVFLLRLLAG